MSVDEFLIHFTLAILALIVLTMPFVMVFGVGPEIQPSTYTGYVVDIEDDRGLFIHTTQIDLKTHPTSSEDETFCIHPSDDEQERLDKARELMEDGQRVTVEYHRPLVVPIWECQPGAPVLDAVYLSNTSGADA